MSFKCYLCGHNAAKVVADKDRFGNDIQIIQCLRCDLVQQFPQVDISYDGYSEKKDFKGQKRKVKISKYLKRYIKKGDKVLEVGCGHGDNVQYLRGKGFGIIGIDKDPKANGLHVDVENYPPIGNLNVIYAIHLLEHLKDPRKFIGWMKDNLAEGGRFILEIPCADDPLLKLYKNNGFSKYYWYPYHQFFFSWKPAMRVFDCGRGMVSWADGIGIVEGRLLVKITRKQEYGILNHLRWLILKRPGNLNFHIPILDDIYKFILTRLGYSDTLIIVGEV